MKRSSRAQKRADNRERLGHKREMGRYMESFRHLGRSVVAVRKKRVIGMSQLKLFG
jgi:hypothetical protein